MIPERRESSTSAESTNANIRLRSQTCCSRVISACRLVSQRTDEQTRPAPPAGVSASRRPRRRVLRRRAPAGLSRISFRQTHQAPHPGRRRRRLLIRHRPLSLRRSHSPVCGRSDGPSTRAGLVGLLASWVDLVVVLALTPSPPSVLYSSSPASLPSLDDCLTRSFLHRGAARLRSSTVVATAAARHSLTRRRWRHRTTRGTQPGQAPTHARPRPRPRAHLHLLSAAPPLPGLPGLPPPRLPDKSQYCAGPCQFRV